MVVEPFSKQLFRETFNEIAPASVTSLFNNKNMKIYHTCSILGCGGGGDCFKIASKRVKIFKSSEIL